MTASTGERRFWLAGKREAAQDRFFREALDPAVWTEGDDNGWETCWYTGMPPKSVFAALTSDQTINHIPGNNALTIKSNLYATLARARERVVARTGEDSAEARRMTFFPRVYGMPEDYHALQEAARQRPEAHWIVKPRNSARGKGISMLRDVAAAPLDNASMVQEYVANPHTISGHKYVLRLYVLITSVEPLRVYVYNEGSAKLASAPYSNDIDDVYAHLTNPDVNATNTANDSPVVFRSLAQYRQWLREQGHDDEVLFARLREMAALTAIAAREPMRRRLQETPGDTRGCYELLGLDCLVDDTLNPWIIECNLSPSLEVCAGPDDGGDVEEQTKRRLVADMVRLLDLNQRDAGSETDSADPAERLRQQARAEHARAGDYTRVYPNAEAERYLPFFPLPRLADLVLADDATGGRVSRPRVQPWATREIIEAERLGLYCEHTGTLYTPNATAAWIWLQAVDGAEPDAIADALLEAGQQAGQAPEPWAVRQQVWDVLADSAADGLLLAQYGTETGVPEAAPTVAAGGPAPPEPEAVTVAVGSTNWSLELPDAATRERLEPLFAPATAAPAGALHVRRARRGYSVADATGLRAEGLRLARLAPEVTRILLHDMRPADVDWSVDGVLVPLGDQGVRAALVVGDNGALAGELATALGTGCSGGAYLTLGTGRARPAGLPVAQPHRTGAGAVHELSDRTAVALTASQRSVSETAFTVVAVVTDAPAGSDGEAAALPLDVLTRLLPRVQAGTPGGQPDGDAVAAAADWLAGCTLRSAEPGQGAALARELADSAATAPA